MKKNKTLSSILALSLAATSFAGLGINANAAEGYEDYIAGNKPANLIPDASAGGGYTYLGARHPKCQYENYKTPGITKGGYAFKYYYTETEDLTLTNAWTGFEGFWLNQAKGDNIGNFGFTAEDGASYVFMANVKNDSSEGVVPKFGIAMNNTYNPAKIITALEYESDGIELSDEWQTFRGTLALPEDYATNKGNGEYADRVMIGFPAGTKASAAVLIDASSKDAVYFAKEAAYDINVTAADGGYTKAGASITVDADAVNQIGTVGSLAQNFEWTVLDSTRTPVTSGFTVSAKNDKATVKIDADVADGTYYVYAKSTDYNMGKAAEITIGSFEDYVPSEKNANLIPDASVEGGQKYFTSRNNGNVDNDAFYTAGINPGGYCFKYYTRGDGPLVLDGGGWRIFDGFEVKSTGDFTFTPEAGKTYVVSATMKNASSNGITPYFGAAMNGTYDPANAIVTPEYGTEGMAVGNDWTDFKGTLSLPSDWTAKHDYANAIFMGFPAGTQTGSAVWIDVSSKDAVYLAEEQRYDISVSAETSTDKIKSGDVVALSANVLNQVGIAGTLLQNFDWLVLDSDRMPVSEGFSITSSDNRATLRVNDNVAGGTYYVYAKSKDYDMGKGLKITVSAYNDYVAGDKPENLIPDATTGGGSTYFTFRNNGNVDNSDFYTPGINAGGYCFKYFTRGDGPLVLDGAWRVFEGFEVKSTGDFTFTPEAGKTYVVSATMKNASSNGITPYFGAAMNGTYDPANAIVTPEYGTEGMAVGNDWTDFKGTLSLPSDWTANHAYANAIFMGFPAGTQTGSAVWIDVSSKDAVYLAEEVAYDINVASEKKGANEVDFTAKVVNQIGTVGNLAQNFDWVVLDSDKNEVSGITITPIEGTAKVKATWNDGIDGGEYTVAAISRDYKKFIRTAKIEVKGGAKTLYVAPNGDDGAAGTATAPLATLAGAREKIKALRASGVTSEINVIFAGGTYYFNNTVVFDKDDSQSAKVTYKAADGEEVVFTGAVSLDLSNASKVTDTAITDRLKDSVKNKVVEIDLSNVISMSGETLSATIQQLVGDYEYPELYLDANKQMLAQWPNGDANYAKYGFVGAGSGAAKNKITYTDSEPSTWSDISNAWVGGYLSYDYLYMRLPVEGIDKENKQITLKVNEAQSLNVTNARETSQRWKIFNVLEELDTPTEWFIDKNTMKLYYYPPEKNESSVLEISKLKGSMIEIKEADNIAFEGITFENTRGNAVSAQNVENITISDCTFKNIGVDALSFTGTALAETDKNYWQRQNVDAAYNCEVSDNIFFNIGGHAVVMDGGNVDTLTPGNNVIKNNIFNRCAQTIKNYETIKLLGCGNSILNNNISCASFSAIRHYGNDHVISYNEIYNVIQETDDCGAIYCGRNTVQRGTVISYNYLHDLYSTEELPFAHQPAIYWDDNQTGMKAEYNIIKDAKINIYTNGVDNNFSNNTSINIKKTNMDIKNGGAASNANTEQSTFAGHIANESLYFEKYANLSDIISSADITAPSLAKYNILKDNLNVAGTGADGIGGNTQTYGTVSNNTNSSDMSIFVDAANQDYRVKNSSAYAATVLNEDFDIEKIGVVSNNAFNTEKVTLAAPFNGEKTNADKIHFVWNYALGATSYKITVAKDANFENIVASKEVFYNYADIDVERDSSRYYWKVEARNTSREFAASWQSDVYSFVNGEKISVTAGLNADNTVSVNVINNFYEDGKNADVYIAQYDGGGRLLAVNKAEVALDYMTETVLTENDVDLSISSQAAKVKIFVWEGETPLADPTSVK